MFAYFLDFIAAAFLLLLWNNHIPQRGSVGHICWNVGKKLGTKKPINLDPRNSNWVVAMETGWLRDSPSWGISQIVEVQKQRNSDICLIS